LRSGATAIRLAALACLLISSASAAQEARWRLQLSMENDVEQSVLGQPYQPRKEIKGSGLYFIGVSRLICLRLLPN